MWAILANPETVQVSLVGIIIALIAVIYSDMYRRTNSNEKLIRENSVTLASIETAVHSIKENCVRCKEV